MLAIKGTCRVCRGALSIIELGLVCFDCEKYHHAKCMEPPQNPDSLFKLVVSKNPWFCKFCRSRRMSIFRKDVIRTEDEVIEVKKKFDTVMDLRFLLVVIEEAIGNINRKCQELSEDSDQIRKQNDDMRRKIKIHEQYGHRGPRNIREWRSRRKELAVHERENTKPTKFKERYGNEEYFEKKKELEKYLKKLQYKPKIEEELHKKKKAKILSKSGENAALVAQRIFARTTSRTCLLQIFLTIAIIAYTLFGAMIFSLTEGSYEVQLLNEIFEQRASTLFNLTPESMSEYYDFLAEKFKINPRLLIRPERDWDFLGSAYFCGTTYTTIGYGDIYPVTDYGKILAIIYAFFGIPLFIALLTSYGKTLLVCIRFFYNLFSCRCTWGCCVRESPENEETKVPLYFFYFSMVLILLIGSSIYQFGEKWTYWESMYFVYLTLSTIGFGDLVPENRYYMMITVVYVIIGLSMTSLIISTIIERLDQKIQAASKKLGDKIDSYIDDYY